MISEYNEAASQPERHEQVLGYTKAGEEKVFCKDGLSLCQILLQHALIYLNILKFMGAWGNKR